MALVIEDGIERPAGPGRRAAEETVAMKTMEIGQSFLVTDYKRREFVRSKLVHLRPRRFSIHKVPGGWRVWRVK